jgi:uncharacterized membrane protein
MPWLEWISLFVRWFHVIAGVAWIGASFYFIWLDNSLRSPPKWKQEKGIKGDLWAVHGGGFYEVAKYSYGPEEMPSTLHWFKWEAYSTWLSGMALLIIVYYYGASAYLIDPSVKALTPFEAISYGLLYIFGGMAIYELACRSKLGQSPKVFAVFLACLIVFACWLATFLFSGRGAYIHVGALIGTIMVGNVFLNIMPAQRKMVDAVSKKLTINPAWGAGAKLRSVHNNYFTLPLLFIMISNHYPMTYQHELNWLVLVVIIALSAGIRHYFNLKHNDIHKPSILVFGFIGMALLALWVSWPKASVVSNESASEEAEVLSLTDTQIQVKNIIEQHCVSCHAQNPTDSIFTIAPLGLKLDSWQLIQANAPKIYNRSVVTKDMPLMNKSNMTEQERQILADWFSSLE